MSDQTKNITIMVADDEDIVLSLVRDALEDKGFEILTSNDSYDCLKAFDEKKIDLLISDIRMPKMNGIDLVKQARIKQPDIEVIFMTGYANLHSAKEAITQGASDYILKPFELNEIRQAVSKAVGQIEKEAKVSSTENQLDHLSDLNEILFTVGDKISQIQMSLKFAVLHCKSTSGSFLYWNRDRTIFKMISVIGEETSENDLPTDKMNQILDNVDFTDFLEPLIINKDEDHPFYDSKFDPNDIQLIMPEWKDAQDPMVIIRVNRALSIYGLLMINAPDNSETKHESNLKFLSITAHQLAMSLENLELLEESQNAYRSLRELQDETIQLEKMATRGEMSAEIGHELNNFLGVVVGSLSLLEHQINNQKYDNLDRHVNAMHDNIEKIKKFTSNLMELRPIATKSETICFKKLLSEVIDYLKPQKRYQGVEIILNDETENLPFEADSLHIQQLLYNLFNNAADALKGRDTKDINVSLTSKLDSEYFNLTIQDSGVGIQPEFLEKAFSEKFTTKEHGHGFGLLVCNRIIETHKGRLHVDSTVDVGTTITIDFPLKTDTLQLI